MPSCFIASRSLVIPSRVTFPFIQCHHVCTRAESGGFVKPSSNAPARRRDARRNDATMKAKKSFGTLNEYAPFDPPGMVYPMPHHEQSKNTPAAQQGEARR